MSHFSNITNQINNTFGSKLGYSNDNYNTSDFRKNVDPTANRTYLETGYLQNSIPKNLEILMQEPDTTIVVKKRMFSSLIENYESNLMSSLDKNFIKCSKRLFQNKCNAISAYERLTKIERITSQTGILDDKLFPILTSSVDILSMLGVFGQDSSFLAAIDTLRKYQAYTKSSNITQWVLDPRYSENDVGEGNGTFELTLSTSFSSKTTVADFGGGSASIQLDNPYNLLTVTSQDIDFAISDVYSKTNNSQLFQLTKNQLTKQTKDLTTQLNSARAARMVRPIKIETNYYSKKDKSVRVFIDEEGRELFYNYDAGFFGLNISFKDSGVTFDQSSYEGANGLSEYDARILSSIINNTYHLISLQIQNNKLLSDIENSNNRDEIAYVRDELRMHFRNKCIIQPMDEVNIFVHSKAQFDTAVTGINTSSLFGYKNNLFSSLNNSISNFNDSINNVKALFGASNQSSYIEEEKNSIVGPEFPTWLWTLIRNNVTKESADTCVFSGICDTSSFAYSASSGSYSATVNLLDKGNYLSQGQIANKPSLSNFDKEIYDPLTPFKSEFDSGTGFNSGEFPELLDENKRILTSGIVKINSGSVTRNAFLNEGIYKVGDKNFSAKMDQNIFYDPDGFVYRWKKGIGTFTTNSIIQNANNNRYLDSSGLVPISKSAFAGQDAVNILSFLITGVPYNYNTFIKAASLTGSILDSDNLSGYYKTFAADLKKSNAIWGNFIPYKKTLMNDASISFMISGQYSVTATKNKLNSLLAERSQTFDKLNSSVVTENRSFADEEIAGSAPNDLTAILHSKLATLDSQIDFVTQELDNLISSSSNADQNSQFNITAIGNDINFEYQDFNEPEYLKNERKRQQRRLLRTATKRHLWKVKSNEDNNLFIVDETYDRDYDINAFEKSIAQNGSADHFKCEYGNAKELVKSIKTILGFEIFANTQGHIEVKVPGYNKIPSSVFYKMISSNERIFPKQLESLFVNQADALIRELEVEEDKIRANCCLLYNPYDSGCEARINSGQLSGLNSSGVFKFLTDENTGRFGSVNFSVANLVSKSNPESEEESLADLKNKTNTIAGQAKLNNLYSFNTQKQIVYDQVLIENKDTSIEEERYNKIKNRLALKAVKLDEYDFINNEGKNRPLMDIYKISNDISRNLNNRQTTIKALTNIMRNLADGISINEDPNARRSILYPNLQRRTEIPSIIEHLIEDELFDDLGPGSGSRYVIKDAQIKSLTIQETAPSATVYEVNGLIAEMIEGDGLPKFGSKGNAIVTAISVDYSMWKMYGFKQAQAIFAPWITEADTQAAVIAHQMLLNERRKIFNGSCTIVGNEYMQPGEVVYIESMDLLFYVEEVQHNFTFGSEFATTLRLTYGHNPGEYFPTMLDIIGKTMYSSAFKDNQVKHFRNNGSTGDQHIATVVFDPYMTGDYETNFLVNSYSSYNQKQLKNILTVLNAGFPVRDGRKPVIEFRSYFNSNEKQILDVMESGYDGIVNWIRDPKKFNSGPEVQQKGASNGLLVDVFKKGSLVSDKHLEGLSYSSLKNNIKYVKCDMSDPEQLNSPSSEAWDKARSLSSNVDSEGFSEVNALYLGIIDIWVKFEDITSEYSIEVGTTPSDEASFAAASAAQSRANAEAVSKSLAKR